MGDDERVRELIAAGELRAAAAEAIRGLGPAILRYQRSLLRDEADAAEAFSDFAETLWCSLPSFRGEASLRTWAYRIAWSSARNVRDQAWRARGRRLMTGEVSRLAAEVRTTSGAFEHKRHALDELRAALPQEDQSLLVLRIDHELSWKEIAEVMAGSGEPVEAAALMKRFERLKAKLARLAREKGLLG